jgi:hypothetical protein
MTQVAVDDMLVREAEQASNGKSATEVVDEALKIYIGQQSLKSLFGTMKEDDFWPGDSVQSRC